VHFIGLPSELRRALRRFRDPHGHSHVLPRCARSSPRRSEEHLGERRCPVRNRSTRRSRAALGASRRTLVALLPNRTARRLRVISTGAAPHPEGRRAARTDELKRDLEGTIRTALLGVSSPTTCIEREQPLAPSLPRPATVRLQVFSTS